MEQTNCALNQKINKLDNLTGNENLIKWVGRHFTSSYGVCCYNPASGFEVNFFGTELTATVTYAGQTLESEAQTPAICVLIDDERDTGKQVITFKKQKSTDKVIIAQNLPQGNHTARVYKITESYTTSLAFSSIETDGYFLDKPEDKKLFFEFYGDSITTGHKNTREEPIEGIFDGYQNGCKTYAFFTSQYFDADISVNARVGIGLYSAWDKTFYMKDNWDKCYMSENDFLGETQNDHVWSFDRTPDIVFINIGTNDVWCDWEDGGARYETELLNLCRNLYKKYNGTPKFVLLYGMMADQNGEHMELVCQKLKSEGYQIFAKKLLLTDGGHPRVYDNLKSAGALIDFLQSQVL